MRMSGVATLTRRFVETATAANADVRIFDTRKTLPGWRRECLSKNCWRNDYGWPVQVISRVEHRGVDYILYLRLRGHYWEGYVIRGARSLQDMSQQVVGWSCDLLAYHWLHFDEYQLEQAKQADPCGKFISALHHRRR